MPAAKCHCGRRLHYRDKRVQRQVEQIVAELGEFTIVRLPDGRRWRVSRHFIALHGLSAAELPGLGFEEVRDDG